MRKPTLYLSILLATSLLLGACSGVEFAPPTFTPAPATAIPTLAQLVALPSETPTYLGKYYIPTYYPESYAQTIQLSKSEVGLVIYSTVSEENWKPMIEAFRSHFPWIDVTPYNLGSSEVFTRYADDLANNRHTADMLISSDPVNWQGFFDGGNIFIYHSPEELLLPNWSRTITGTYTFSSDPLLLIYNKRLVAGSPQSLEAIGNLLQADPAGYKGEIVTGDAELNAEAFAANWFWTNRKGQDAWRALSIIGQAQPLLMTSDTKMVDAVGKGQAKLGYFVSASSVQAGLKLYPDLGWSYILDGQPVLLNDMAITSKAASPYSAQLMMDFILSQEGQYALSLGGLTPYRDDIASIAETHYNKISMGVGEVNIILNTFDARLLQETNRTEFLAQWRAAIGKYDLPQVTPTP